jgi:hypothetical protein
MAAEGGMERADSIERETVQLGGVRVYEDPSGGEVQAFRQRWTPVC